MKSRGDSCCSRRCGFVCIDDLPPELLSHIIELALTSAAAAPALLLVCKAWSLSVHPTHCVLLRHATDRRSRMLLDNCIRHDLLSDDAWTRRVGARPTDQALASGLMRDAVVCGGVLPLGAFAHWGGVQCLQLCCMRLGSCVASLALSSLRALRLQNVWVGQRHVEALQAALRAATALEHVIVIGCDFCDADSPTPALFEPLQHCRRLRSLELGDRWSPQELSLHYLTLPQLQHLGCRDWQRSRPFDAAGAVCGPALTSLVLVSDEREPGAGDAALAALLTGNASIRELQCDFSDLTDELAAALASMTGVRKLSCMAKHGPWGRVIRCWAPRLTDVCLMCVDESDEAAGGGAVLPALQQCRQLTSLTLEFGDVDEAGPDSVDFARAGELTWLRSLHLADWARRWRADAELATFVAVMCRDMLPQLRALTTLALMSGGVGAGDRERMQAAAACEITWTDRGIDDDDDGWKRVPEEYRMSL